LKINKVPAILIYNLSTGAYLAFINIAAFFNHKARLWIYGRKGIFEKMGSVIKPGDESAWFHCASLGEFEQGRPVIEALRMQKPGLKIVLTFFSPSGYEIRKNYSGADYVFYLPHDSAKNAVRFINMINPKLVVFVKYEFWYYYLSVLHKNNIPVYLISAIFRNNQIFFRWYGVWYREMLRFFRHIFLQDNDSLLLLNNAGIFNASVAGDTRFDRVLNISRQAKTYAGIEKFCDGNFRIVAGSTWPRDETLLASFINGYAGTIKLIIAPHEVHEQSMSRIEKQFTGRILRFSRIDEEENPSEAGVLIIDNIGMLSSVYRYGNVAYVGGGFGKGIHNILEAAAFGIPVIFGPKYSKFIEARELIRMGGAVSINNANEFTYEIKQLIGNNTLLKIKSLAAGKYVESKLGATERIITMIGSRE
jgi:3-deoxy-D-manno-octulosonic-acid transferase